MNHKRKRYDRQFRVTAARVVLEKEKTIKGISAGFGIKDTTLRRWADEYEEFGENAFPGNNRNRSNVSIIAARLC